MIRQLENEIGEPLLIRDQRQFILTDAGRVVFERGREVLASMRQLTLEVQETQALQRGVLNVGMPPTINLLFTPVLKSFRAQHPHIRLILHEDTGPEIERQVASGELEIGMSVLPTNPDLNLVSVQIASHSVWALGEPGAFKVNKNGTVSLEALRNMPLVLLKDDFALTRLLHRTFQNAGIEPKIAAQSSQWDWTVSMASAGMGVALLPEPLIARLNHQELLMARVSDPDIPWQVAHIWNGRYLSHAARAWLEVCQSVLGGQWIAQAGLSLQPLSPD